MKNSHKMALATIKHSNKLSQDKILWHFQLSQRISHVALFNSHDFPEPWRMLHDVALEQQSKIEIL
jgi:hypothetical protein